MNRNTKPSNIDILHAWFHHKQIEDAALRAKLHRARGERGMALAVELVWGSP